MNSAYTREDIFVKFHSKYGIVATMHGVILLNHQSACYIRSRSEGEKSKGLVCKLRELAPAESGRLTHNVATS